MRKVPDSEDGFTIVEIIIAIAVAGLFIISLSTTVINLQTLNNRASDLVLANSFIQDKAEEVRADGHVSLVDGVYDFTSEMPVTFGEPRSATYTVTEETLNTSVGNNGLKLVVFNINYDDYGIEREIEYATYIGELGVGQY